VGTCSNRSGIGARVRVTAGGLSQIREVNGGSGFHSQDSLPVEFGLGDHAAAVRLIIYWPSGTVQILYDVAVDQVLTVIEASTTLPYDVFLPVVLKP